jgi:hypothetical protein
MIDTNMPPDATTLREEILVELERHRCQGFLPCVLIFSNIKGDLRLATTIDDEAEVVALLTILLRDFRDLDLHPGSASQ